MPKAHPVIWRVSLTAPLAAVETFEAVLDPHADAVSWFLDDPTSDESDERVLWRLEGFSKTPLDRAGIEAALAVGAATLGREPPPLTIEQLPDTDWVTANLRDFPPISAGHFFVHGSHFNGRIPAGKIPLLIDAGTAFGSGEHATTFGCLSALAHLMRRRHFRRPLDLGCGSGILAIAIAKTIARRVQAADIDPVSVRVATRNAKRNGVAGRISACRSDGYRCRTLARHRPYDLIVANILARPLAAMAADLGRHLASDGVAVLSGLLNRQERFVLAAHRSQGLSLVGRIRIDGWSTLVLARSPRTIAMTRLAPG
ncbi:50S ribosomal protein L11 methyltransferase [Telmatospirillum siberiense]|uniref:Ribosomal protein L11 methyltransferase n=1 Tax=Telmatospirillum siberiense TaxID=382514 RepID=A0A2N3PQM2_9PROT|nr:50S ribosomal protein L11 methyltransferase [Telmatospirillum siberiense]PKU22703.1 50S ribosomal protein L11 methyltransferase [Telmatospirillum siberiense]